ncbi:MAG: MFS transporter [Actinobacteria bacterium]|nr:MAG: MFS transporter [Actinomycetota bacterium]
MAEAELPGDGDTPPLSLPPRQSLPPPGDAVDVVGGVRRERRRFPIFGYPSFIRLWAAQGISSLGDWIGLFAVLALAARIGKSSPETAVGIVMIARMIPGFFLASVGGVLVDRWSRKKVMVTCDIGRGMVMASLPFLHTVWELFLASLLLEILSLLWTPAKEASVPNLVPHEQLTTANSLSLVAAYGTFPLAGGISALLFKVAEWASNHYSTLHFLHLNKESVAIYADVASFFVSAALISTLTLQRPRAEKRERIDLNQTIRDLREGWSFIGSSPVVRSVILGLGTGLIGGGMVVPLGPTFSSKVLHGGDAGFTLLLTAMGTGVATGVLGLSAVQRRAPKERLFPWTVLGAGGALIAGASMSSLALALIFVGLMGIFAGGVYVMGFTLVQENVSDEIRGRVFATLYTTVRLCLVIALTVGPLLAAAIDKASPGSVTIGAVAIQLSGVRITLWFGGVIIIGAGLLAERVLRGHEIHA